MGTFFEDFDHGPKIKSSSIKVLPPIPHTGWVCPKEFPNLYSAQVLAFDVETKEPDFDRGPGWSRDIGHIVGLAIAAEDKLGNVGKWYFPVRHEVNASDNLDPAHVFAWIKPYLENPTIPKVGANLMYDVGWMTEEDIWVQGDLHDVQYAEALLDNDARVALQILGQKYCGRGKETDHMYDWITKAYSPKKGTERGEIYRTPPSLVGFYGEQDAVLPLETIKKQWPTLAKEGLLDVYRMECDLIYVLVRMRRAGVQIDLNKAESLYDQLTIELKVLYAKLSLDVGRTVERVSSAEDLAPILDKLGIKYKMTAKSNKPSINKDFFETVEHPIVDQIQAIRQMEKVKDVFLKSYILDSHVNSKVHGQFHLLKGEGGGAITGRLSSSTPNLQNIGSRTKLGKQIRYIFGHDPDHVSFGAGDYAQIEYRLLCHHAVGPGADAVREQYNTDLKTDYHKLTQKLVKEVSGITIPRNSEESVELGMSITIKEINFGLLYGMKENKLGRRAKLDKATTKLVFEAYHSGAPYVKATMTAIEEEVQKYGYITTISGRRTRFNLWECNDRIWGEEREAVSFDAAINKWGSNIKRAYAYRGVNYELQGGAADVLKKAMWCCWKDGVYDTIGVPRLTVHDENGHSIIDWSDEQRQGYEHMNYIMENATKLRIPIRFDWSTGKTWGDC